MPQIYCRPLNIFLEKYKKMKTPISKRVSFIVNTKNRAGFLDEALGRARKLVTPDDELIVVDGASTDNTLEVVNRYQDLIDIFISEPDISGSHALNKGILLANGKYIRPLADDDVTYPEAMEQVIKIMDENPDIDVLVCGGEKLKNNRLRMVYVPPGVQYGEDLEKSFNYTACGAGFVIRRLALAKVGYLVPVGLAADREFITQLISKKAKVKFCRIKLFHHPIYDHSMMKANTRLHEEDSRRIIKEHSSRVFYLRFRLRELYNRIWWRLYVRIFGHRPPDLPEPEYLWDGGFS